MELSVERADVEIVIEELVVSNLAVQLDANANENEITVEVAEDFVALFLWRLLKTRRTTRIFEALELTMEDVTPRLIPGLDFSIEERVTIGDTSYKLMDVVQNQVFKNAMATAFELDKTDDQEGFVTIRVHAPHLVSASEDASVYEANFLVFWAPYKGFGGY